MRFRAWNVRYLYRTGSLMTLSKVIAKYTSEIDSVGVHTKCEFILINDAIQKLSSIRVRLNMTQEKSRNMYRYHPQRIQTLIQWDFLLLFAVLLSQIIHFRK
jgi:hypothetical protein